MRRVRFTLLAVFACDLPQDSFIRAYDSSPIHKLVCRQPELQVFTYLVLFLTFSAASPTASADL